MYCKYCRNVIPEGTNVCPKCGAGVVRPETTNNNQVSDSNNTNDRVVNIQNTIVNNISSKSEDDQIKKSFTFPIVLVLIIAAVIAYFVFK